MLRRQAILLGVASFLGFGVASVSTPAAAWGYGCWSPCAGYYGGYVVPAYWATVYPYYGWGWRQPYYGGYYGWGWRRPYYGSYYGWGWRRPYLGGYGWGWRRPYARWGGRVGWRRW